MKIEVIHTTTGTKLSGWVTSDLSALPRTDEHIVLGEDVEHNVYTIDAVEWLPQEGKVRLYAILTGATVRDFLELKRRFA